MKFLVRTGLVTGIVVVALVLTSALWAEYSARNSCASVGSPAARGSGPFSAMVETLWRNGSSYGWLFQSSGILGIWRWRGL